MNATAAANIAVAGVCIVLLAGQTLLALSLFIARKTYLCTPSNSIEYKKLLIVHGIIWCMISFSAAVTLQSTVFLLLQIPTFDSNTMLFLVSAKNATGLWAIFTACAIYSFIVLLWFRIVARIKHANGTIKKVVETFLTGYSVLAIASSFVFGIPTLIPLPAVTAYTWVISSVVATIFMAVFLIVIVFGVILVFVITVEAIRTNVSSKSVIIKIFGASITIFVIVVIDITNTLIIVLVPGVQFWMTGLWGSCLPNVMLVTLITVLFWPTKTLKCCKLSYLQKIQIPVTVNDLSSSTNTPRAKKEGEKELEKEVECAPVAEMSSVTVVPESTTTSVQASPTSSQAS